MLKNLPETFPLEKLSQFYFGDAEARRDDLLSNPFYFCRIRPIENLLNGRNNLVVGAKGTGKSAIFRLLSENKMSFKSQAFKRQIVIPIEADSNLLVLKQIVLKYITLSGAGEKDLVLKYRIAWEMYILYRILCSLSQEPQSLGRELQSKIDLFGCAFTYTTKHSIVDFFKSLKATVGVRISAAAPAVQDVYTKIEASEMPERKEADKSNKMTEVELSIDDTKREVQEYLCQNNVGVFVLYDKLDEFVIKEEYDVQKAILQALLLCESSYHSMPNIKHFIFLRSDLFDRMDFDQLGSDKVYSRKVDLVWEKRDIIDFISKRICYNYFNVFNIREIELTIDMNHLFLDENRKGYGDDTTQNNTTPYELIKRLIPRRMKPFLKRLLFGSRNPIRARITNLTDELNMEFINAIFPDQVKHKDKYGAEKDIKFVDYIVSHTATGFGATNPRIIILFLNKLFEHARDFYNSNSDLSVRLNDQGRYPLFTDAIVRNAYDDFKQTMLEIFTKLISGWKDWLTQFISQKGNRQSFSYDQVKEMLKVDRRKEAEFRRFLAFLNHVGFLCCKESLKDYSLRKYALPIIFQQI